MWFQSKINFQVHTEFWSDQCLLARSRLYKHEIWILTVVATRQMNAARMNWMWKWDFVAKTLRTPQNCCILLCFLLMMHTVNSFFSFTFSQKKKKIKIIIFRMLRHPIRRECNNSFLFFPSSPKMCSNGFCFSSNIWRKKFFVIFRIFLYCFLIRFCFSVNIMNGMETQKKNCIKFYST